MPGEAPGFARDVRPLFRERDVRAMDVWLDLSSYEDVRLHAEAIWRRLDEGSMPCDGMWAEPQVALFRAWVDAGCPP